MSSRKQPVLFCNTAWMKEYRGNVDTDPPCNGGSWIAKHKVGSEIHNFLPYRGRVYGYVASAPHFTIEIGKLRAPDGAEAVHGVRVFWTATHPNGGRFVVGWYDNATVFRAMKKEARPCRTVDFATDYIIMAASRDAHLIPEDERQNFPVPDCRQTVGKWGMGQSNVRYMDERGLAFLKKLQRQLGRRTSGLVSRSRSVSRKGRQGRQQDSAKRIQVEHAAMAAVKAHYSIDWECEDKSRTMGLGYDYLARHRNNRNRGDLFLEVKGCSGSEIVCELTPSERRCMFAQESQGKYRLCVVTKALDDTDRKVTVFAYHPRIKKWTADGGMVLQIETLQGARCFLSPAPP